MTGDQAAVALVSGEAGIGKTRLVRELVAVAAGRTTTLGVIAQPGSMGRPLDAVAVAGRAGAGRRRAGERRVRHRRRGHRAGPGRARGRGPPLDRRGERQPRSTGWPSSRGRTWSSSPRTGPTTCPGVSRAASWSCGWNGATRSSRCAWSGSTGPRSTPWSRRSPPRQVPTRHRRSSRRCTGAAAGSRSSSRS